MMIPNAKSINTIRIKRFKDAITEAVSKKSSFYLELLTEYQQETESSPLEIAAALASTRGP